MTNITLGTLDIEVDRKDIKNIHLSVYPPDGRVHIAAPERMELDTIRVFALGKLPWIRAQQEKFRQQVRETPREYLARESHYFLGQRYLLAITERDQPPAVVRHHRKLELVVRPGASIEKRRQVLEQWYRQKLKQEVAQMITHWEPIIGVKSRAFGVKKMRTKWGTCNPDAARLWFNLELVKKPRTCIEFIVVHELVHLLERTHNERFIGYMDLFLPNWRQRREELNALPFRHVEWEY